MEAKNEIERLYFAYGSNLWREQMRARCPNHQVIANGVLKGYRWIISARGYANIVKSKPDEVHGAVYKISESDENRLDCCEGVHRGSYRKEMIMIEVEGKNVLCLVYIDPIEREGRAKKEYIEKINRGICDSELPSEYVNRYIRKFIPI
jgi:gamma-glutamylcyclotransferase